MGSADTFLLCLSRPSHLACCKYHRRKLNDRIGASWSANDIPICKITEKLGGGGMGSVVSGGSRGRSTGQQEGQPCTELVRLSY